MKKLLSIALIFILFSCTSTKKEDAQTPMQFSEKIVSAEMALAEPLSKAEQTIRAQADSSNYKAMGETAERAEKLVQNKIDEIEKLSAKDFKGGDDFKRTAIDYFEYVKSIYTSYKKIGKAENEGVRLAETRKMDTVLATQQNVITMMQAAQDKFATENGFPIEK